MEIYPWQHKIWQQILAHREQLPHALLLQGHAGDGTLEFAVALARSMLCEQPGKQHEACGLCQSCGWFSQRNHPDFRMLEPETEAGEASDADAPVAATAGRKNWIVVDQVRALTGFFGLSSHRFGLRIVLLNPAESLNPSSANALLKMLEEPPVGVLFLLVTYQVQRLLPTLLSRCRKIAMPRSAPDEAMQWLAARGVSNAASRLAYAGGAPLLAASMGDAEENRLRAFENMLGQGGHMDAFSAAGLFPREGMVDAIDALQKWSHDLLAFSLVHKTNYRDKPPAGFRELSGSVHLGRLLDFQRKLEEAKKHVLHPLNAELQLESLMVQYTQMFPDMIAA